MTSQIRKPYLIDLADEQWTVLQPLILPAKPAGRPRKVDMREVINTILYLNRTGCQWLRDALCFFDAKAQSGKGTQRKKDGSKQGL